MLFKSPSKELTCPAGLLVAFQGWETLNFHARLSVRQQLSCPKSQNPTFLMRICWSWNLNPSPERLWEMQNLIFYPPKCLWVCVCVFASGRLECNSSDEVTCWSLFKHLPPGPLTPSIKHVGAPRQLTRWLRLLAHITSHLSQSLPMIAMIWHCVFGDLPQAPVMTLVGGLLPSSFCASGSVPNSPICSEWTPH